MAVDGYLNFDTRINTDGFEKGADKIGKKAGKTADKVSESAEKAAEKAKKAVSSVPSAEAEIKVTADVSEAVSAAETVKTVAAEPHVIEVSAEADFPSALDSAKDIEAVLPDDHTVSVIVDADAYKAEEAISAIDIELGEIASEPLEIGIEADATYFVPQLEEVTETAEGTADRIRKIFSRLSETFSGIAERASEKVGGSLGDTEKRSETTADRIKKYFRNAGKSAEKSMSASCGNIGGSLEKLKGQLKGVAAAVGLAFGVRELLRFGKSTIETAAEVNAAESQLVQTFGGLQDSAEAAIQRVADASGIVVTRLKGAGTSIYAFAKASGMESSQALGMMEEALQTAADSAAYYDRSLEETTETLKSFLKGNYANDAALGVSATETTRNAAAMKLYGKSFQELSESQKQLALLDMVKQANKLSGAEGQAAREADGWENVTGNLKETWKQLMAVVGQPVLHIATDAVKQLTAALAVLLEKAQAAVNTLSQLFGWETENTAAVASNIAESVTEQEDLTAAVEETEKAQKGSLASFDKMNTVTDKQGEKTAALPVSATSVNVEPVVRDKDAEKAADKISEKLSRLIEPIQIAWEDKSPELIANAERAAENIKGLFDSVAGSIAEVWTNGSGERFAGNLIVLFSDILGIVGDIAGAFKEAWDEGKRGTAVVQSVADWMNTLLEAVHAVTDAFRTAWNDGTGAKIFADILDIIKDIFSTFAALHERFTEAWNENGRGVRIFKAILGILSSITGTVKDIADATADWAKTINFAPLLESIGDLLEAIKPLTDNIGEGLAWFYKNVLLPLGKWTVEKALPVFLGLLASAIKVLNAVITVLKPLAVFLFDNFLKPLAKWTGGIIISVLEGISSALSSLADWIMRHQELLQDIIIVIGSVAAAIGIVLGAQAIAGLISALPVLLAQIVAQTAALAAYAAAWIAANLPIIAAVAAIAAVIAIGVLLVKHWDEVKAFAKGVWDEIEQRLWMFFDKCVEIFGGVTSFFKAVWTVVSGIFKNVGEWFTDKFKAAAKGIKNAFRSIGSWFKDRWNEITGVYSIVSTWFRDRFTEAWNGITGVFSGIGSWFSDRWNEITAIFAAVGSWFRGRFDEAVVNIKDAFGGVGQFFGSVWDGITSAFSHVTDWFRDKFSEAWRAVKDAFTAGGEIFHGITGSIAETFKNVVNSIIDGINSVIADPFDSINTTFWVLRNWDFFGTGFCPFEWIPELKVPHIPRLAQGTVVPANYGEFLAVLGDNKRETEIVSPVSAIKRAVIDAMAEAGDGAHQEITVICTLDGKEIGRAAVKAVKDDKTRRGG